MRKLLVCFAIATVLISGCKTTGRSSSKGEGSVSVHDQVRQLKNQLTQEKQKNETLRKQLNSKDKLIAELQSKGPELIIRMPTVKEIQTALKNAGFYEDNIDGRMGIKTAEAIRKFQESRELYVDGTVGSRTWNKLKDYLD